MKLHHIPTVVAGVCLAVLFLGTQAQRDRLGALRTEISERRSSTAKPPEPTAPARDPMRGASETLSDAELAELLALRRDVGQLRPRRPNLEQLGAENARLRSAITNTDFSKFDAYVVASRARFVGLATPEDALQSFLFAVRNRDTNVLFQVLGPASRTNLAAEIERQGADQFFAGMGQLPGFRVLNSTAMPDGTFETELQIDPRADMETIKFPLVRVNGEWRLEIAAER